MPKKKRELSPETIERLKGIKREPENSPGVLQFKFEPICDLEQIKKQKAIKKQLKFEKSKLEKLNNEKNATVATSASCEIKTYSVAPDGEHKLYKPGWNSQRAEAARERININKPWVFSTGARTSLGKSIIRRNAIKSGIYCEVLKTSSLEFVEFSVTSADIELNGDINDTSKEENEDAQEG